MMGPIDVLVVDDEPLARRRLIRHLQRLDWVGAVAEAATVQQALTRLAQCDARIVLLDIQMPGGSGFDLVPRLPAPAPAIVFVTAFDDQARRAFDAHAIDYVTKPIDPGRLHLALERARQAVLSQGRQDRIAELEEIIASLRSAAAAAAHRSAGTSDLWVKSGHNYLRIPCNSITHIQAERDYARIHADGRDYLHSESLSDLERSLPAGEFMRIHRSTLVRLGAISHVAVGRYSSLSVVFAGGKAAKVGRTYAADVRARLMQPTP